jgi:hypothetical protein
MKKWPGLRIGFIVASVLLAFAIAAVCFERFSGNQEQQLFETLQAYDLMRPTQLGSPSGPPVPRVRPALSTNSLPILLKWLRTPESEPSPGQRIKWRLYEFFPRLMRSVRTPAASREMLALDAFEILGTNALPAIPELRKMIYDTNLCEIAASAFICIGPPAFPVAAELSENPNPLLRRQAAFIIGGIRTDGNPSILQKLCGDSDAAVRTEACTALAEFPSDVVLPRLRAQLGGGSEEAFNAAYALHSSGSNAVAALIEASGSTNKPTKTAALAALTMRKQLAGMPGLFERRFQVIRGKRCMFNNQALSIAWLLYAKPEDEQSITERLKKNFEVSGDPRIEEVLPPFSRLGMFHVTSAVIPTQTNATGSKAVMDESLEEGRPLE